MLRILALGLAFVQCTHLRMTPEPVTITFVGTNDIHGTLAPIALKTRDALEQPYRVGGLAHLAATMDVLRQENKDFLWLDGGDQFQGTLESNSQFGAPVVDAFNQMGLMAAAVGNHEFDFGIEPLRTQISRASYPYLAANIWMKDQHRHPDWTNLGSSKLFVTASGIRVGVIGLSTIETPKTTMAPHVADLRFEALKDALQREARLLRQQGANVIALTAHAGLVCKPDATFLQNTIRTENDPQSACETRAEIPELLNSIPEGTVDLVVSGHTHHIVHHFINHVPVIQGGSQGRYINTIQITYDPALGRIDRSKTRIEGPIPICPQVFANQADCNGNMDAPPKGRGPLIQPVFHGIPLKPDARVQMIVDAALEKTKTLNNKIIAYAETRLSSFPQPESDLGNLIADAMIATTHADVALMNSGGIRMPLESGPIRYNHVFRTLPFENKVATMEVTGAEIRHIATILESGSHIQGSVAGMRIAFVGDKEHRHIHSIVLNDGTPLDPHKIYTLATVDFLILGGDDFAWPKRPHYDTGITIRDSLLQRLRDIKRVKSAVDPQNARLFFIKQKKVVQK